MFTIPEALDLNTYVNYGTSIDKVIFAEVVLAILNIKKSIPYYRIKGTEVKKFETRPLNLQTQLTIATQIIESIQEYNDSAPQDQERRVSVDFDNIDFDYSAFQVGQLDCSLEYIALKDLKPGTVKL